MPEIECPNCKKRSEWSSDNPYRPFCSKRCRMIDLGEWLSESYRVPSEEGLNSAEISDFEKDY